MKPLKITLGLAIIVGLGVSVAVSQRPAAPPNRAALKKQFEAGNFKDAYEGYRQLALDPADDPRKVGDDLTQAASALQQLGRIDELDDFREAIIRTHAKNWRLLWSAAETYLAFDNYGFIIAGKFYRGQRRGGGQAVNSLERDRVRALQLMVQAMPLAGSRSSARRRRQLLPRLGPAAVGQSRLRRGLAVADADCDQPASRLRRWLVFRPHVGRRTGRCRWKSRLLPYPEILRQGRQRWRALAVVARSSGRILAAREKMRSAGNSPISCRANSACKRWPTTVASSPVKTKTIRKRTNSGAYALNTLADDETIARLATGIKRFRLPDEFNFIKIYQQIAAEPQDRPRRQALEQFAQIFENRRQYPRAADYWRRRIKEYGPGENELSCSSGSIRSSATGGGSSRSRLSRPGKERRSISASATATRSSFEAHEIKVDEAAGRREGLSEIPSQAARLAEDQHRRHRLPAGASRIRSNISASKVAAWELPLKPRPEHFDRRITVATPLQKAGAYLLTAKMADGNTSQIILWLDDTAIVKKPLDARHVLLRRRCRHRRADREGQCRVVRLSSDAVDGNTNRIQVDIANFAEFTDADGQVDRRPKAESDQNINGSSSPGRPSGRFAYLGFTNVWYPQYYDAEYNQTKVFTITDRPVYRPGQTVKFKFWVRHAKYDQPDKSDFANQTFTVEIRNPKGDKVLSKRSHDRRLRRHRRRVRASRPTRRSASINCVVNDRGGGSFPRRGIQEAGVRGHGRCADRAGDARRKDQSHDRAKYYFGSPVTKAKVKYKVDAHQLHAAVVSRSASGIGSMVRDIGGSPTTAPWYPGWRNWGCPRPVPWWWPHGQEPPEVVADAKSRSAPTAP